MTKASVSVLMPVFNAMPYLPAAIESILGQTLPSYHLLCLDDGSSDGSSEYLNGLRQHPNVSVIRRERRGVGAVRNHGLQLCRTEYLALMDADDVSMPERLSSQLEYLSANRGCVMVGTQIDFLIGSTVQEGLPAETRPEEIERRLLLGGGVVYPTLMFRTEVARSIGGFRLQGAGEEYDFCLRMSERGRVSNIARVLYQYRLHSTSISMTKQTDLLRGAAYARTTAMQRRSGVPEVSFDEFDNLWRNRGSVRRLSERIKVLSNMSYRRGRISLADGRRAQGLVQIAIAAGLDPLVAAKHVRHIASRFSGRSTLQQLALKRAE